MCSYVASAAAVSSSPVAVNGFSTPSPLGSGVAIFIMVIGKEIIGEDLRRREKEGGERNSTTSYIVIKQLPPPFPSPPSLSLPSLPLPSFPPTHLQDCVAVRVARWIVVDQRVLGSGRG